MGLILVDLLKVAQVLYSAAAKQDSDPTLADAASHPAPSLTIPPSKNKSVPTPKPDKQRKPISITLTPQPPQDSTTAHPFLTLYPTSKTTAIEWRDALRFLTGVAPGNETEEYTKRLADVGVRVKLLDIVAGGVEIPLTKPLIEGVSTKAEVPGKVAITGEFWYDNMVD